VRRLVPNVLKRLRRRVGALDRIEETQQLLHEDREHTDSILQALGRIEMRQLTGVRGTLQDHEFKVYSHAGEDGIIQYLASHVKVARRTFVEFGVEDYREANTRFLLQNNHWDGLVIDGDPDNVRRIEADPIYWNANLVALAAFVTRDNINELLTRAGFEGEVGLLSIDVDGNDYWIFDAITAVKPAIAIVEYNHRFGPTRSVTIPYDAGFVRRRSDPSWLVCGASLAAIVSVAARKGMAFVGCNSFGNNAFFVREELLPPWLPKLSAADGFVPGKFKESMTRGGVERTATPAEEQRLIAEARLVEVV
jgi:hypothetical protein